MAEMMKALVYTGTNTLTIQQRPKPSVTAPTDAVVRMLYTSICGSDLHIIKGDVPSITPGRVLGHEGVGVVESLGSAVHGFSKGDRVLVACMTSCGACGLCRRGIAAHCQSGGWQLGNKTDGTQAELPETIDSRAAVAVSDALPTALECGVMNSNVQPGGSVVIIGAGPVGISCVLCARLYSPALLVVVDLDENRLETARKMGAHATVNAGDPNVKKILYELTAGQGFDSVIEAVGIPVTFELGQELVAVGGSIANVGVHGTKVDLHLEKLWDRNISRLPLSCWTLLTHCFPFSQATVAYDTFRAAASTKALKVAISFNPEDEEAKERL
ncbi:hypothetical protein ATEG_03238 [Aspergillus terreus NIH2624]|uniref:Enoyl reductase (ER) domain-containing protein n=1 Tax=Aspergillus terreus (strain NIH 2624 / FGSC A1156) TaxID=341663 RepID=Q0CSU6_ASPTN|nr:uncharacterized protein ATEG_03238 [Aspergillus terreus NIH2624]EAU36512.1 hypothetical protein ATEG_03238 [Aspergillus terreus NIH2624]